MRRGLLGLAAYMLFLAMATCGAAGRLDWTLGWAFLATFLLLNVAAIAYLWHTNAEIVVARSVQQRGDEPWDWPLFFFLNLLTMAIFPVAAIDAARFRWSSVPLGLTVAGYVLFVMAMAGIVWVLRVNKFAEQRVRIQAEHKHKVGRHRPLRHRAASLLCGRLSSLRRHSPQLGIVVGLHSLRPRRPGPSRANGFRGSDAAGQTRRL